jgi:F0F1-type ATP synthase assembly protein I
MGLAICRKIVEVLGGGIGIEGDHGAPRAAGAIADGGVRREGQRAFRRGGWRGGRSRLLGTNRNRRDQQGRHRHRCDHHTNGQPGSGRATRLRWTPGHTDYHAVLIDELPAGLLITAAVVIVLAAGFDLSSIASIGSAIALLVFTLITAAHFRVRGETGASTLVLSVAITSTVVVLLTFALTTLVDEPATAVALGVIVLLSVALDIGWKRIRESRIPSRS